MTHPADIRDFEALIEPQVDELAVLELPLEEGFTLLETIVFNLNVNGMAGAADALASRASYLLPRFRATRLLTTMAMDELMASLVELVSYGHFCELMPDVHRGVLSSVQSSEGYELTHASEQLARVEALDVTVQSSSRPVLIAVRSSPDAGALALNPLHVDTTLLASLLESKVAALHVADDGFLDDAIANGIFGVSARSYRRIAHACAAFGTAFLDVAAHVIKRDPDNYEAASTWVAPHLDRRFFIDAISQMSDCPAREVIRVCQPLIHSAATRTQFRDGLVPIAIATSGDQPWTFSAWRLTYAVSERNALYTMNRARPSDYATLVSPHVEPAMCALAERLFEPLEVKEILHSRSWQVDGSAGECDMLVISPDDDVVVQIQAKAVIGPEGSRMTKQVQDRVHEAHDQLRRFSDLPSASQAKVWTSITGRDLSHARLISMIMTPHCFGRDAWTWDDVVLATLPLLELAASTAREAGDPTIDKACRLIAEYPHAALTDSGDTWSRETIELFGCQIAFQVLEQDPIPSQPTMLRVLKSIA